MIDTLEDLLPKKARVMTFLLKLIWRRNALHGSPMYRLSSLQLSNCSYLNAYI